MKQRITPEQLQELTSEQQEALRKWWKPEEWELIYVTNKGLNTFGQAMRRMENLEHPRSKLVQKNQKGGVT